MKLFVVNLLLDTGITNLVRLILWGFTKFFSKPMLKVSAFYIEKQKSFIPKNYDLGCSLSIGQESSNRWGFAVPIFHEGFG